MRELSALKRALTLTALMGATILVVIPAAAADTDELAPVDEVPGDHCVADVLSQESDGELNLSEERCYPTFAEAMSDASDAAVSLAQSTTADQFVGALESNGFMAAEVASFTVGIHYQGKSGSGSSITIKGSACNGGYWNTGSTWANRISSSYLGCQRLRHYSGSNKTGMQASLTGRYSTKNLPSAMNNKTRSVSYHSS